MRFKTISISAFFTFLSAFSAVFAQNFEPWPRWGLSTRLEVNVPLMPEPFAQYWMPSAGTGLELAWFAGKTTAIVIGAHYAPILIEKKQWVEKLEPKLEGAAKLGFAKGGTRIFDGSLGLKKKFPFEDRPFSFLLRLAGEYAYLYQQKLKAVYAFPEKTLDQEVKLGQSQFIYGGCAGLGAEVRLSGRWGLALEAAFRYFTTVKDESPSPDLLIHSMVQPDETGKGFGSVTVEMVYYFGFTTK
jgi:hypothetical protein